MTKKCPIITITGTQSYKEEMEQAREKLTKQGYIVLSIGDYGKEALDMRLDKIDLAEELFVLNPIFQISESTWIDICYAHLLGEDVSSMKSLSYREIQDKENYFLYQAEELAQKQLEMVQHNDYLDKSELISFKHKGCVVYDPWIREDMQTEPFAWNMHENPEVCVNPFEHYGKKVTARYIAAIMEKNS